MAGDPTLPQHGAQAGTGGPPPPRAYTGGQLAGLGLGLGWLAFTLVVPGPEGLSAAGWHVVGLAGLMALWWTFEVVPVPVTALAPLIGLPALGVMELEAAAAPYANPLIYLFLSGFLLAKGLERWALHKRMALAIAAGVGTRPDRLVLGFMAAAAVLSMWVSNTATAVMMVPIAASVIAVAAMGPPGSRAQENFSAALLLGVAFGASIGGMGTLIGSPPNAFLAGYLAGEPYGLSVTFASWAMVALPLVAVLLPLVWLVLTRLVFPCRPDAAYRPRQGADVITRERHALGPLSTAEWRVGAVACAVALTWVFGGTLAGVLGLPVPPDVAVGLMGGLALFLIPAGGEAGHRRLLTWEEAVRLPWGVLVLFGGGLSLAGAIGGTDLAGWLEGRLEGVMTLPLPVVVLIVTLLIGLLTNLTSNTATSAAFLPVVSALALEAGENPLILAVPAAFAASCAFMLPVATPPNAVVFASGDVTIAQMLRAGSIVNLIAVLVIALLAPPLVRLVFGA